MIGKKKGVGDGEEKGNKEKRMMCLGTEEKAEPGKEEN